MIVQSLRDAEVHLHHKHYAATPVTKKSLLVAVKVTEGDAFVLTTFFTSVVTKGERIWEK